MRQQSQRAQIPRSNSVVGHVMPARADAIFDTAYVDVRIRSGNKEKHDVVTRVMRAKHDFDLTLVRHDGFKTETVAPLQANIAFEIGNGLRLSRTLRFWQGQRQRDLVGIDVNSKLDAGILQIFGQGGFSRTIRTGNNEKKRRIDQSAALGGARLAVAASSCTEPSSAGRTRVTVPDGRSCAMD